MGTIRYGVKLAANDFDRYANDRKNVSANSTPNNKVTNEETEADLSDVSSTACRKGCCCINGSKLPLPKNAIDGKKAQNELNPNSTGIFILFINFVISWFDFRLFNCCHYADVFVAFCLHKNI